MAEQPKCRWFHHWHYVETVNVFAQTGCGEFKPNPDKSQRMEKFICCHCGKTELRDEPCLYV